MATDPDLSENPGPPRTVRPETFGAIGNGIADDTAALQAARDYAASEEFAVIVGRPGTGGRGRRSPDVSD